MREFAARSPGRRRLIEGDGSTIAVHEFGVESGPPVVFLHGWSMTHLCWHRQLVDPELASRFRLVAMELPGHGDSAMAPEAGVSPERMAGHVRRVFDELAIERGIAVGWSFGGVAIADYLAFHGTGRLSGAVFVGVPVDVDPASGRNDALPPLLAALPDMAGLGPEPGEVRDPPAAANAAATTDLVRACVERPMDRDEEVLLAAAAMSVPPAARRALLDRGDAGADAPDRMLSVLSRAAAEGFRSLVCCGADDRLCDPRASDRLAKALGGDPLRYAGSGHAVMLDDPGRFGADLLAFAGRAPGRD